MEQREGTCTARRSSQEDGSALTGRVVDKGSSTSSAGSGGDGDGDRIALTNSEVTDNTGRVREPLGPSIISDARAASLEINTSPDIAINTDPNRPRTGT